MDEEAIKKALGTAGRSRGYITDIYKHPHVMLYNRLAKLSTYQVEAEIETVKMRAKMFPADSPLIHLASSVFSDGLIKVGFRVVEDIAKYEKVLRIYLNMTVDKAYKLESKDK